MTQCLSDDFEVFRKRDLSSEELLYLELDGTFLRYHQGAEKKEPILVATGHNGSVFPHLIAESVADDVSELTLPRNGHAGLRLLRFFT